MPVGYQKNLLYGLALPILGLRPNWRKVLTPEDDIDHLAPRIEQTFKRNHVVGGSVQRIRNGKLAERYLAGYASLHPSAPVTDDTLFRTASIAKMACALLVMRLQTQGKLDVYEDISAFWGKPIRNPNHPDTPIPLAALLSHTSGMMDSPLYYRSFSSVIPVEEILADGGCFTCRKPFEKFQYSNFAAGLIGCLLEKRFGESLETLAQRELFTPLGAQATFDLSALTIAPLANSYRVLPPSRTPAFDARKRAAGAAPLDAPDPQTHYLLGSGGLLVTAEGLARLALPLMDGGKAGEKAFLTPESVHQMKTPLSSWPQQEVDMRHGMGLFTLDDRAVCARRLYGHQGFAYGAVNGVFFDDEGNGFVSLNSGASERRFGHLSCLNRDLIDVFFSGGR